jgi:hypothetical protein
MPGRDQRDPGLFAPRTVSVARGRGPVEDGRLGVSHVEQVGAGIAGATAWP